MRFLSSLIAASVFVGGIAVSQAKAEAPNCHVVLFGKKDFRPGQSGFRVLFTDEPNLDLQDFNNKTSSIVIVRGTWRFFSGKGFEGESKKLGPGLYPNVDSVGIDNNRLSSLKCIS